MERVIRPCPAPHEANHAVGGRTSGASKKTGWETEWPRHEAKSTCRRVAGLGLQR